MHLEKSLKNHMGSRKNRNFGSQNFRFFSKFLIFSFSKKSSENFHVNITFLIVNIF